MPTAQSLLRRQLPRIAFYLAVLLAVAGAVFFRHELLRAAGVKGWENYRSVREVVAPLHDGVASKFRPICERANVAWPPAELVLLVFKQERRLELWAQDGGKNAFLAAYPVLGLSGKPGPKRRSGDLQVPEGFYELGTLNPNSQFHLSIKVKYPNAEDLVHAEVPRERMGGDIYVHGGSASIGCVAIGDPAIEVVFTLASLADARRAIISPEDFRRPDALAPADVEPWLGERYARLKSALAQFPAD
jgi:hypothetical protein